MKTTFILSVAVIFIVFLSYTKSEPGFNTGPGCGGSGCHATQSGIVTAEVLNNFQVRITVTGTTSKVGVNLLILAEM